PVIASENSSISEVCGDAAYYIDPCNTHSISNAILKINDDKILRLELIKKGLQRAANFKWEVSAYNHLCVFENVLAYNCFPTAEKRMPLAFFNNSFSPVKESE
ncbi:MAG: hypothetical protein R3321_15275, partial [Nitrososphaeraceae archaeon]|nr:hypothetical protein [Nitrososphaeraceae archaeon]